MKKYDHEISVMKTLLATGQTFLGMMKDEHPIYQQLKQFLHDLELSIAVLAANNN